MSSGAGMTIGYGEETVVLTRDTILSIHLAGGVRLRLIPGGLRYPLRELSPGVFSPLLFAVLSKLSSRVKKVFLVG